jgi:outer membrane protein assembly factor BamB
VLGDVVFCESTAPGGTVTAFDKKTSVKRWSSAYNGPAGHTGGAAVMTIGGANYLAYLTLHNVVVMGADKGSTVGTTGWSTAFEANIPSPGVLGNLLFITSGYGNKLKCYEVTAAGLKEKWSSPAAAKVASPVAYKDSVFVIDGHLKCVDITSGKVKWQGGNFGGSSSGNCLVAAGDNKVIAFGGGSLVLLDASATEYNELAKVDGVVSGTCYPQVALANGIICCKDAKGQVTCLSVGKGGAATPPAAGAPK